MPSSSGGTTVYVPNSENRRDHDPRGDPIEGCRRGDPDAQHRLFHVYKDRVYSLALLLCRNSADAAEITQDVFLKVFQSLDQFRGDSKFETWLFRIVVNAASDHHRRMRRQFLRESGFWWNQRILSRATEQGPGAASTVDEAVRKAVRSLPPKLRVCVVLRYVEALSYEEIAATLDCPSGTVAARLSRAHRLLARKLASLKK